MIRRLLVALALVVSANAAIIPDARRIDWSGVGIPGGIPSRTTVFADITAAPYLCDKTGGLDSRAGLISAIAACPVDQVLYAPAGTYRLSASVSWAKRIVIRGDVDANGAPTTSFVGYNTSGGAATFVIGNSQQITAASPTNIVSGYTKGSTSMVVTSATGFSVGRMVLLDQMNDGTFVTEIGGEGWAGFVSRANWATATMTIASPCVVTWTNHHMLPTQGVSFATTGALPTGLTAGTTYYVIAAGLTADTFELSATSGGSAINTSGSQSGVHTGAATGMRGMQQMAEITSVSGTTIGISPGFFWDYTDGPTGLVPQAVPFTTTTTKYLGLENVILVDNGGTGSGQDRHNITFVNCENVWMKNVWSQDCWTGHVYLNRVLNSNFTHCYLNNAKVGYYTQNHAYGFRFGLSCTSNLIDNNILGNVRGSCILEYGASGNVVAYNYALPGQNDAAVNAMPPQYQPSHGAHPMMNLFEGNIGPRFQSDWIWGTSSHQTIFRNALLGIGVSGAGNTFTQLQNAFDAEKGSTYFNVVGNVIGQSGVTKYQISAANPPIPSAYNYTGDSICYRYGFPGDSQVTTGGDSTSYSTILQTGNYDYSNNAIEWDGSGVQTIPDSLYLSAKPSYFGILTWPNVEPTTATVTQNAAQYRYVNGFDPPAVPTVSSVTINSAGTAMTVNLSISCTTGAGLAGGMVLTANGGASTATYSSGSGSTAYVYSLSRTIQAGETITLAYTQPGNGIESTVAQDDLASFSGQAVTNNSTAAPVAPSGLTATAAAEFQINLAWTDNSGGVATFSVEQSLTGSGGWSVIASPAAGIVTYANNGLSAATTYYYRVRALSGGVYSSYTSTANATTPGSKPFSPSLRNPVALGAGL